MTSLYWISRLRTLLTLLVLAALLVVGVTWGFNRVTAPFPEKAEDPTCVEVPVAVDDVLRPGAITVSVLNASGREGLAQRTLDDLVEQGFAKGELANGADDVEVRSVAILTDDPRSPAVRLLRSYLGGKKVQLIDGRGTSAGLNVVVGEKFSGVQKGRAQVVAASASTVCTPPALS